MPKSRFLCLRVNCRFGINLSFLYIWSISLDFSVQRPNCISRISTCLSILIPRKATRQMCYGILTTSQMMFGNILHIIWCILYSILYALYINMHLHIIFLYKFYCWIHICYLSLIYAYSFDTAKIHVVQAMICKTDKPTIRFSDNPKQHIKSRQ